ncbi:MAG: transglycosylase domain-containing protein [Paenibacillaceae bacterium]|nr:transglycosylase domain-containing protein [Paenibacillaceae bacterium]
MYILKTIAIVLLMMIKWVLIVGFISGVLAGGVAFGYVSSLVKDDTPRTKEFMLEQIEENAVTGFVYFKDETVIGQLRSDEDRRLATLSEIPEMLQEAVIAVEDKDFYEHNGISIGSLLRAVRQKVLNEEVQTGGSTITQQLARRVFLSLDREDSRKAKEILLSMRMERLLSKDEILLAYLNKIPYGNGASGYNLYGIKAAAKGIFDIDDLSQLNVAQCAYLAGLPQLPSNYSAFTSKGEFDAAGFKRASARMQIVLKRMLEEQKITETQYDQALAFDLKGSLAQTQEKAYTTYPYLMVEVEKRAAEVLLAQQYPNLVIDSDKKRDAYNEALKDVQSQLSHSGYHIYTTIDQTIYDNMQAIAQEKKNFTPDDPKKGIEQVGAVLIENKTGAILGMIEGRNFYAEQLNHATQAYRQPGSAMKPLAAYGPAMELGKIQPGGVIDDTPVILKDGQTNGYFIPENWDKQFHGLITARQALNSSYNIPAIKLFLYDVGINQAWDFVRKMGITSITKEDSYAQTGVIGGLTKGVSVEEMTNAYATFANKGVFYDAFMISKIVDSKGKTIYEHTAKPVSVFSPETSYLMTDMMRTVITSGTANDLVAQKKFKHYGQVPVVGKTGSTQDDADAWFVGYSPDVTVGVWAGYDQPVYKLTVASGGTARAKNVWAMVMDMAIDKRPELFPTKQFEKPANIVSMTVSNLSGKLPSDLITESGHLVTDLFNKKFAPQQEDDVMVKTKYVSYEGVNYVPLAVTPEDMQQESVMIRRPESLSETLKKIKDIEAKIAEDRRKPLGAYMPPDAGNDAPTESDPRVDDGKAPDAPGTPVLTKEGADVRISFAASPGTDIVGYRLYRSVNKGAYQKTGKVVLVGKDPLFTDTPDAVGVNSYYVTAVDVAGRESSPSRIVGTDGSTLDPINVPGFTPIPSGSPLPGGQSPTPTPAPGASGSPSPGASAGASVKPDMVATAAPTRPRGLALDLQGVSLHFKWTANPAADKVQRYDIYYSDKENGNYRKLGSATGSNEFMYTAVVYDGYYRVTAVNSFGESTPSAFVSYKSKVTTQ